MNTNSGKHEQHERHEQQERLQRRLRAAALLEARADGDRLLLDDAVLAAALDGSRPLTAGERAALQASPLTRRRLRQLALERRATSSASQSGVRPAGDAPALSASATLTTDATSAATSAASAAVATDTGRAAAAANDADWRGSHGRLRAASSAGPAAPVSDDGWWALHLLGEQGAWRLVLQLSAAAPFAARLLAARAPVRVRDGVGAVMLEGRLDPDGECEAAWSFADPPAVHMQAQGAAFSVEPA